MCRYPLPVIEALSDPLKYVLIVVPVKEALEVFLASEPLVRQWLLPLQWPAHVVDPLLGEPPMRCVESPLVLMGGPVVDHLSGYS